MNKPSPVVYADSKFFGSGEWLCVDVLFSTREELDALIQALVQLRDSSGEEADHVHLQDGSAGRNGLGAEVTFHRPGPDTWNSAELVDDAKQWLQKTGSLRSK